MLDMTRGLATLVGAGVAGFLVWLAAQMDGDTSGGYWATYGLLAAAGLTVALSQVLGGWTKWGWPRIATGVFVLGFLPVAVAGLWVLLARDPGDPLLNTAAWSEDLGIGGAVADLGELLAAVAFGVGLTLGLTFDTAGPRIPQPMPGEPLERGDAPPPAEERAAADEPLTAETRAAPDASDRPVKGAEHHPHRVIRR